MTILQQVEQLLRNVAGDDLAARGCYIIGFDEIERDHSELYRHGSLAWTSTRLDMMLQPWLTSQGRWTGRGFACILNPDALKTLQDTIGCACHEIAHWLSDDFASHQSVEVDDSERLELVAGLVDWVASDEAPKVAWQQHEARFCRAAAHLAYRIGNEVESVRPRHLRFSQQYVGVPENTWMTILSDELSRSTGSIADILTTEPPEHFTSFWKDLTCEPL